MEVIRNGQPYSMTRDAYLPTGATVTKDGFVVSATGQRKELREGQAGLQPARSFRSRRRHGRRWAGSGSGYCGSGRPGKSGGAHLVSAGVRQR